MSKDTKICPHCNAEGYTHTKGHSFGVYTCYTTFNMYSGETVARDPVCEGRESAIAETIAACNKERNKSHLKLAINLHDMVIEIMNKPRQSKTLLIQFKELLKETIESHEKANNG